MKRNRRSDEPLSAREQMFVAALLADPALNQTNAALAAGYSPHTARSQGSDLMTRANVARAVREAQGERIERTKVDADFVLTEAVEIMQGAKHGKEWSAATGALTLVAKLQGLFTDKVRVDFRDVGAMSDEELESLARGDAK